MTERRGFDDERDDLGLTREDYLRWVRESRVAQGLPEHIGDDPAAVDRLAKRLRESATPSAW